MKQTNKKIKLLFGFALGLSIGLPAGVLGIVFGAIKDIIPLLVFGILLVVGGFYVMPILWVQYGEKRKDRTLLKMIEHDNVYTIRELAAQMGFTEKVARERVKKLIVSRELTGYLLVDDELKLNTNEKQKNRKTRKCANCGANMVFKGDKLVCEYCGSED